MAGEEVTDPSILALLNGDAAPAQPQAVTDPELLKQLDAAPADVAPARPQLQPSQGVLGPDNSADATPSQVALDNSSAGRILDAFKQGARDGWGDQPLGLSEESLKAMRDSGHLVALEDAWKYPGTFFNEMLMQSGAVAFDLVTRGGTALTHALGTGAAQIAGEVAGETKTDYLAQNLSEFLDVAGLYAGGVAPSPKMGGAPKVGPRIDIAEAQRLGVTLGEAEYAGIKPVGKLTEAELNANVPPVAAAAPEPAIAAATDGIKPPEALASEVVTTPDAPVLPPAPSKVEVPAQPTQRFDDLPPNTAKEQTKLNLQYKSSTEVQDFIRQQAIEAGDYTTERRSGTSWAESERLGQAMGVTPADIMKREIGEIRGASWMDAATNTVIAKTQEVRELWQKAANGTDADKIAALNAEAEHSMLMGSILGNEAEVGRALNIIKKFKTATAEARDVAELIKENGGLENLSERARLGSLLDTPQQVSRFVNDAAKPKLSGMLQELWINGLLSGPVTQAKNIVGNVTLALWRTTESGVAAGIGLLRGLPEDRVMLGEPVQRAYAIVHSGPEMLKAAWKNWKEDDGAAGSKLDGKFQQIPSAEITVAGHKFLVGGKQIRIPGRALAAMDGAFKTLAYRQSIAAQAWRKAAKSGVTSTEAFKRNLAQLNDTPTPGMIERAVKEADLQTLSQSLGKYGRAAQTLANANLLTKMIAPFVKFGINSAKFAGERSVFSVLHPEIRSILKGEKGAAARDEQLAKIMVGTSVSVTAAYMASQGMVTGGGPKDPAERALLRATGWAPYSFKVGDTYYAGNWNDPASTLFFAAADMAEITHKVGEEDASTIAQLIMASVMNNITSKTYFQGVSDSVELMNDPVRYGQQWLNKQAGTVIPTGVAQAARLQDPYLRDARTVMDTLQSRLPKTPLNPEFNSQSVYPVRDVWGNPIKREGALGPDAISPIYTSTEKNDPLIKELDSAGLYPSKLERQIVGVELTPRQYDDYQRLAGKLMRQSIEQVIGRVPNWKSLAPDMRKDILEKAVANSRKQARNQMVDYYSLAGENDPINRELASLGMYPAQVDRQIRGTRLTIRQYDDYQRLAGKLLRNDLGSVISSMPQWGTIAPSVRKEILGKTIERSRENARKYMLMYYPGILQESMQNKVKSLTGAQ